MDASIFVLLNKILESCWSRLWCGQCFLCQFLVERLILSVIAATVMAVVSVLGRMVNALVVGADEGRGNLR